MILSNNEICLNDKYLGNIKIIINWYVSLIRYEYKNNYISPENYENYLIFISDILPILKDFKDREEFLEIGYWLSKAIKSKVQNEFEDLNKTSMFTGLGFIAFSVYSFNKHYKYGFEVKNNYFYQDITNDRILEGSTGIVLSLLSIFNPESNYKDILLI